jgi:hypothetical protein
MTVTREQVQNQVSQLLVALLKNASEQIMNLVRWRKFWEFELTFQTVWIFHQRLQALAPSGLPLKKKTRQSELLLVREDSWISHRTTQTEHELVKEQRRVLCIILPKKRKRKREEREDNW